MKTYEQSSWGEFAMSTDANSDGCREMSLRPG